MQKGFQAISGQTEPPVPKLHSATRANINRSLRSELAEPLNGSHSAVHEEVAPGDETAVRIMSNPHPTCHRLSDLTTQQRR